MRREPGHGGEGSVVVVRDEERRRTAEGEEEGGGLAAVSQSANPGRGSMSSSGHGTNTKFTLNRRTHYSHTQTTQT